MNRHLEADLWANITSDWAKAGGSTPALALELWAQGQLQCGALQSLKQVAATLGKWTRQGCYDYGVSLWLGWPVPGKRPRRLEELIRCIGCCEDTFAEGDAYAAGWRWATVHTGEPDWLCRECLIDDVDNPWS